MRIPSPKIEVAAVGMLPGTAVYVYAGSQFPDLQSLAEKGAGGILSLPLLTAFIILGLFPLITKKTLGHRRPVPAAEDMERKAVPRVDASDIADSADANSSSGDS